MDDRNWPPRIWLPYAPALAALYLLTYWTSDVFRLPETGSTPWNPEAGLAVIAVCILGPRILPGLALVHFICLAWWAPFSSLPWTAVIAAGHMAALGGIVILRRQSFTGLSVPGSTTATSFIAAATAATAASALVQMATAALATDWSGSKILQFGMTVSVGNMVGILTVVPVLLQFPDFKGIRHFLNQTEWGGVVLLMLLTIICVIVFGIPGLDQFKFFYLVFLPVIALALRDGITGAAISTLVASGSMIVVLSLRDYNAGGVAELQFLMIVLAVTGLLLGAVIDERQRLHGESVEYLARLNESEAALMRASRISLASEMAAAVSHEMAQPLSAARSYIRALKRRISLPRRNRQHEHSDIDAAVKQIDAAAGIIRNMRQFLQRGETEKTMLDLPQVLAEAAELVRPELQKDNVHLHIAHSSYIRPVLGNRTQITQVLLNLLRNAREAMSEIHTARKTIGVAISNQRPGFVEVNVTDNGPGVKADIRPKLFAPLHSSKPDGLGLGLSLSNSIIAAHGGSLWYNDAHNSGASFSFTLPVFAAEHQQDGARA